MPTDFYPKPTRGDYVRMIHVERNYSCSSNGRFAIDDDSSLYPFKVLFPEIRARIE
jgi:hypothetical protein